MRVVLPTLLAAILGLSALSRASAADRKVDVLKEAPTGLSADVTAALNGTGYRVSGPSGVVCDVWLAKSVALKPKFKPDFRVKYPFQLGELIGAIRFPASSKPSDFRGQPLKPGIYTLRYGLQPDDGNHLGTSEIRDFLVGSNPKDDASPKRVEDLQKLFKLSSGASGTTHPAIFLLIPPAEKPADAPAVRFESDRKLLILDAKIDGKDGDAAVSVPVSLVTVGKHEE